MHRIGLALSGGGFRATLFHLGMVRFLREADVLPKISHITSVSGGSVLAAHLVLNWGRYTGSMKEFEAAAAEIVRFVQLDVRNRVVRRFPLGIPLRALRRLALRGPARQLTRTGLLEYHYEKFLYGDTCLFQLPQRPRLFILATNLSEGCLCAFSRDGLLIQRRRPGQGFRFDRIHTGLATVPMAVTASSAFPGFFPPLELRGQDVGADPGQFGRLSFTDGGVYDNLGVRMFRYLEQSWMAREIRLQRDDLADAEQLDRTLQAAVQSAEDTPLHRLAQMMALQPARSSSEPIDRLLDGLWDVMTHENLAREPVFARLSPPHPDGSRLLNAAQNNGSEIDAGEQLWLNRQLVEAACRQETGKPCFRSLNACFDAVLVSDAGKRFKISSDTRAGGLISTAVRASDIGMDRVWQLEIDNFTGTPGFVFAPISGVVEPDEDPTTLHPEVQRMVANIRTDLDRFSLREISALVRHGYCVGRKACKARPDLFGAELPANAPWDPVPASQGAAPAVAAAPAHSPAPLNIQDKIVRVEPAQATVDARTLGASAGRRIWSALLDWRDWVSYIYVPILVPILVLLPYFVFKSYQRSQRLSELVESLSQGSRDLQVMSGLLEGPVTPWSGEPAEEMPDLGAPDFKGFDVLQDSRILDMRKWNPNAQGKEDPSSMVYGYRRLKVVKREHTCENNVFRMGVLASSPQTQVRFPLQDVQHHLRMSKLEGNKRYELQASWDFQSVPIGEYVDLVYEHYSPALFLRRGENSTSLAIPIYADTAEVTRWFLLPEGKEYKSFRILQYETGKPQTAEVARVVTQYLATDSSILAYKMLSAKTGYTYDVTWYYK
jgi:predicted acylesterase/phospholipase RssA